MTGEITLNAAQIARMAGVARGTVLTWRRRHDDFGTGAAVVGAGRAGDPAGPAVHVIRPDPARLNSWFLAGFLLPPGSPRRATGNRVDVRQLEAPLLPLADQERYARVFRDIRSLESISSHLKDGAGALAGNLTAGLASGDFRPGPAG